VENSPIAHCPFPIFHFPCPVEFPTFGLGNVIYCPALEPPDLSGSFNPLSLAFSHPEALGLLPKKKIPCFSGLKNLAYCRARRLRVFVRLCVATDFWIFPKQQLF